MAVEINSYPDAVNHLHGVLTGDLLWDWIDTRKEAGASWRTVRDELRDRTGIVVSDVTLIRWHKEARAAEAAA